ncbi:AraC family transcriptional regulator of arabinose operon [Paenibacillus phyllosphaerae]|uniref:AraC family transcriptional regulator of arabinose operon n=1 Tax=Paenibacillus phyllosphaerae TaxID=274593 RepID=A0A7W5FRQ1_9BACL|nr:AraC family transcriptional regulator [Paenibacillus phyllosphaerae]MBB3114761.1 AraC family transcriptional regulator of arabinose operon [Paenibacillus phyllosphaerae]
MTTAILTCGYSYHTQRFHDSYNSLPCYLIRLQTEGSCEALIQGERVQLDAGTLLILPPGSVYSLYIGEPSSSGRMPIASGDYYLLAVGEWLDRWCAQSPKPHVARIDPDDKLLSLWRLVIAEKRRQASQTDALPENSELIDYLLRTLCLYLERAVTESAAPSAPPPFAVLRLKRFIEENATGRFKLEEAAQHAGLSVSRAVHLFKEHVGRTMMDYATEVRLSAAMERMKYTSIPLQQIAETCGFGEYSYFHKVFKQRYGSPPGAFRRRLERRESGTDLL